MRPAPPRWRLYVLRRLVNGPGRTRIAIHHQRGVPSAHSVLLPYPRANKLPCAAPCHRLASAVSAHPRLRHDRLDRRRVRAGMDRLGRSTPDVPADRSCRCADGPVQPHTPAHASALEGQGYVIAGVGWRGCVRTVPQAIVHRVHAEHFPDLHPASVLLPTGRQGRPIGRHRGRHASHELRAGLRDRVHVTDAAVLPAAGREVDACNRDAGVAAALRAIRSWHSRCRGMDDVRRDHSPRHLL